MRAHRRTEWGVLFGIYLGTFTLLASIIFGLTTYLQNEANTRETRKSNNTSKKALDTANEANEIAKEDGEIKPNLKVAKISAYIAKGGATETTIDATNGAPESTGGIYAARIELTMENLASGSSLITKATATFRRSEYLEPCYGTGGPLVTTAKYDLTIPNRQPVSKKNNLSHKVPFTLSTELTHQIKNNEHEKFWLTVGPRTIAEGASPWIGVIDVALEHDGGESLKVGPIAVIGTGANPSFYPESSSDQWVMEKPDDPECMKRNAARVTKLLQTPQLVVSRELSGLNKALRAYR